MSKLGDDKRFNTHEIHYVAYLLYRGGRVAEVRTDGPRVYFVFAGDFHNHREALRDLEAGAVDVNLREYLHHLQEAKALLRAKRGDGDGRL